MRVLICGDRKWTNKVSIMRMLRTHSPALVIEGDASGADKLAGECAQELGIALAIFPANWDAYHKAAGPIRNQWMLNFGQPDEVWAFHPNLDKSKGTADMVKRAQKANIRIRHLKK